MPTNPDVLDRELEKEIIDILDTCGIHAASVSIRRLRRYKDTVSTKLELKTITARQAGMQEVGDQEYTVSSDGAKIFQIASITKVLIAVAVAIAEAKAENQDPNNPYARFKNISEEPITKLYNEYRGMDFMDQIPGDPTIYDLIVHYHGLPSSNHRLLTPDGKPMMTPGDVVRDLVSRNEHGLPFINETGYSNINYSVVAIAIEALWGGRLDTFMNNTLFNLLGMDSTSIGIPTGGYTDNDCWVINSKGQRLRIQRPHYQATGAEAGPMGAYSTVKDLDTFFEFLLNTFHRQRTPITEFTLPVLAKLLKAEHTEEGKFYFSFTPFGLWTTLDSTTIGALSTNRLQFPQELFSTYPVLPGSLGAALNLYYMAGSAIGCGCATAFLPDAEGENVAVTVLTDTSGPVDASDHILRLILRKIIQLQDPEGFSGSAKKPKSVIKMVKRAMEKSLESWKKIEHDQSKLKKESLKIRKSIEGVFQGDGFSQKLSIYRGDDQVTRITLGSSSTPRLSSSFELLWIGENSVQIVVQPHLSIDRLGNGDWSNLVFQVYRQGETVTELRRKTNWGKDHFDRFVRVSSDSGL